MNEWHATLHRGQRVLANGKTARIVYIGDELDRGIDVRYDAGRQVEAVDWENIEPIPIRFGMKTTGTVQ